MGEIVVAGFGAFQRHDETVDKTAIQPLRRDILAVFHINDAGDDILQGSDRLEYCLFFRRRRCGLEA
ncbi:hypothetical protein D3C72_1357290 [compost metagenome]